MERRDNALPVFKLALDQIPQLVEHGGFGGGDRQRNDRWLVLARLAWFARAPRGLRLARCLAHWVRLRRSEPLFRVAQIIEGLPARRRIAVVEFRSAKHRSATSRPTPA
jgi:hypothetical protein